MESLKSRDCAIRNRCRMREIRCGKYKNDLVWQNWKFGRAIWMVPQGSSPLSFRRNRGLQFQRVSWWLSWRGMWQPTDREELEQYLRAWLIWLISINQRERERMREHELGMVWAFKTSKPSPSDSPSPKRPHLPTLPKLFHRLGIKYSNMWDYGGYSHSKHTFHCLIPIDSWQYHNTTCINSSFTSPLYLSQSQQFKSRKSLIILETVS